MTTEVLNGGAPAQASESATPEAAQTNAATTLPETGADEGGEKSQVTPKTYTEEEHREAIERATAKAAAKAERRAFREATQRLANVPQSQRQPDANDGKPSREQYASDDAYVDALTDWKLDQRDKKQAGERQQQQAKALYDKTEAIYAQAEKIPGFDREEFESLPLTSAVAQAIADSDVAPQLMAHFVTHPEDMSRIGGLSPARQAAEIGKLETKLSAAPAKSSKAPDPTGDPGRVNKTSTVPNDPSKMSHEQFREWRKKQGARWAN